MPKILGSLGYGMMEYWNDGVTGYGEMIRWVIGKINIDKEVHDLFK